MGSKENGEERESDTERDSNNSKQAKEGGGDSDYEPARDSLSSQEDTTKTPNKKSSARVPKKLSKKDSPMETSKFYRPTKSSSNRQNNPKLQSKPSQNDIHKKTNKSKQNTGTNKKFDGTKVPSRPSSEISEEIDERTIEIDEPITCDPSNNGTDEEEEDNNNASQKLEEMETRIEKLEQELREVAALEISIYSVVPEHMSSANKVHTPARRLSRLYIHASKYWSPTRKATVAKNIISGLVLVAKSCGNDVSRLTYWLSNTVVLRQIICETFGNILQSSPKITSFKDSNPNGKFSPFKQNNNAKKNLNILLPVEDWRETTTFTSALERIESWIFSRIVESVWWQALTPHMQTPERDLPSNKNVGKLLGPNLGDVKQGNFSIDLWNNAFQDAFTKLCPLRASGHECGCLPILSRMVMEECVSRLDIAMFNAILRESESEIPTDPVSDPILDIRVLPIPAGDLSFGSGAQLKNSIGNWSRLLSDNFGMDSEDSSKEKEDEEEEFVNKMNKSSKKSKTFSLLNELSDLLMLPKDLLLETPIRKEVCPSIALSIVIRILCNFTPDEFCPDPVPGIVLEELNSESMAERLSDKVLSSMFPYTASPVTYYPPSLADVAESQSDVLERKGSMVQRRGYTSDEDLDDLDSPMGSIIDRTPPVTPSSNGTGGSNGGLDDALLSNARYKLLREVWCE